MIRNAEPLQDLENPKRNLKRLGIRRRHRPNFAGSGPYTRAASSFPRTRSISSRTRASVEAWGNRRPIPAKLAGSDVRNGGVTVQAQRLYRLVDLPAVSQHRLSLIFDPGISGYAFTFG